LKASMRAYAERMEDINNGINMRQRFFLAKFGFFRISLRMPPLIMRIAQ